MAAKALLSFPCSTYFYPIAYHACYFTDWHPPSDVRHTKTPITQMSTVLVCVVVIFPTTSLSSEALPAFS